MKPMGSMMFMPGNKPEWKEKSVEAKADELILDLEDVCRPTFWSVRDPLNLPDVGEAFVRDKQP